MHRTSSPKAIVDVFQELYDAGLHMGIQIDPTEDELMTAVGMRFIEGQILHMSLDGREAHIAIVPKRSTHEQADPLSELLSVIWIATQINTEWPRSASWKALRYVLGDAYLLKLCRAAVEDGILHQLPAFPSLTQNSKLRSTNRKTATEMLRGILREQPMLLKEPIITPGDQSSTNIEPEFLDIDLPRFIRLIEIVLLSVGVRQSDTKFDINIKHRALSTQIWTRNPYILSIRSVWRDTTAEPKFIETTPYEYLQSIFDFLTDAINLRRGHFRLLFNATSLVQPDATIREEAIAEFNAITRAFTGLPATDWIASTKNQRDRALARADEEYQRRQKTDD